jgi:hypothetical protein
MNKKINSDFSKWMKRDVSDKEMTDTFIKIKNKVKKFGHTTSGTIDGKDALERPFAHTFGASFSTGCEFICFFPIKGEGLRMISGIFNKVIKSVQDNELEISNQILDDESIYYLPLAMLVLDKDTQEDIERVWAKQLERDAVCSELSTDDHQLVLLIASDKDGVLPWKEGCSSYWPQMCPPPFVAMAQLAITGKDTLLTKLEKGYGIK